jgi:GxxExxY protein
MSFGERTDPEIERIATQVVDAAFTIHSRLGPGLLESAYEAVMAYELTKRRFTVERQVVLPVVYDEVKLDDGYRIDMIVNGLVILELKSVEKLAPVHDAQVLTYLKLTGLRLGILINFNNKFIKDGIKRIVL